MNNEYLAIVEHRRRQKEFTQKAEIHRELKAQQAAKANRKGGGRRNTLILTLIEFVVSLGR